MNHPIAPIPCKPWTLNGLSDRLIVSHYENNYGGAIRSLNAARERLATLDLTSACGDELRALKEEELSAAGSVALHELYFGNLGPGSSGYFGDGKMPDAVSASLADQFGSVAAWRFEFVALARALGARSGWVLLCQSRSDGRLSNQILFDHAQAMIDAVPVLALDMYEHAYYPDFGANATAYVDAFMRNIDWACVAERMAAVRANKPLPAADRSSTNLPSIAVEDLAAQVASGDPMQVLDARPRHYFSKAADMMEGAIWRDPERVEEWVGKLSPDRPVAVYCAYGFHVGCSVTAALRERGFDARYIRGGLSAWYGIGGARGLPATDELDARPSHSAPERLMIARS
jgi:Fe-Mn family superoxide dismutase